MSRDRIPPEAGAENVDSVAVVVVVVVAVQKSAGNIVICLGATIDSEPVVVSTVDIEILEDWTLDGD